jgi:3-hydroxypropionyl-CoA synthetase (ADP-forming)
MTVSTWLRELKVPGKPDESEAKALLRDRGISVPSGRLISPHEIESITRIAEKQPQGLNFPLIAKVCSPDIIHKTEMGGLELNLNETNWTDKLQKLYSRFPGKNILLEEMIPWVGNEFILGALVDPSFGPTIMCGAGGILTELYKDVSFRLIPLDEKEAGRMLQELTISEVLNGYRGSRLDPRGLAEIISRIGELVVELGEGFSQLDINPIVFDGKKWVALDAVLLLN